jgi:hypothetical protein
MDVVMPVLVGVTMITMMVVMVVRVRMVVVVDALRGTATLRIFAEHQ